MLVKRINPSDVYLDVPCSAVAVGTAMGNEDKDTILYPDGLHDDGYLSLAGMNRFLRQNLAVTRKIDYRRGERPTLIEFLRTNDRRAVICVAGHFLYADKNVYYSFLKNGRDPVITVWYLD